jgi:hypothetical protein
MSVAVSVDRGRRIPILRRWLPQTRAFPFRSAAAVAAPSFLFCFLSDFFSVVTTISFPPTRAPDVREQALRHQLLGDAEQAVGQHVHPEGRRKEEHHDREDARHQPVHHLLLHRVHALLRGDALLADHRGAEDERQRPHGVEKELVGGREVGKPQERRVVKLHRRLQRRVEREPDGHLHQRRQAPAEGVDLVLAPQLHHRDVLRLRVVLELRVQGVDLGLEPAHRDGALDLLPRQRKERRAKAQRQDDDGQTPVAHRDVGVDPRDDLHQHLGDDREGPQVDEVLKPRPVPPAAPASTSRSFGPKKAICRYVADSLGASTRGGY